MVTEEKMGSPCRGQEHDEEQQEIEWTPYAELHLINSLGGLKAIGINHHFCMAIVWQRFTSAMHVNVSPETLRKRLETFYDFANADKLVGEIPFPNEEVEFSLPLDDFPALRELQASSESSTGGRGSKKETLTTTTPGKRFSSPIIPKPRGADSARKSLKETSTYKHSASPSPSLNTSSSIASKKDQGNKRGSNAEDSAKKKSGSTSWTSYWSSRDSPPQTSSASTPVRGFDKKLMKESRVVLMKGRIDDMASGRKGMKFEDDKKPATGPGKKRQGRLSEGKASSPTPAKRARH